MTCNGRHSASLSSCSRTRRVATVFDAWRALGLSGVPNWAMPSPFGNSPELAFVILPDCRSWVDFELRDQGGITRFFELALGVCRGEARWLVRELDAEVAAEVGKVQSAKEATHV